MDIEKLKIAIAEKDKNLELAAHYGKKLLEDNKQLNRRLEQERSEHIKKIEELEQQKHSLQMALELKSQIENSQIIEIESLKENLEILHNLNKDLNEKESEQRRKISDLIKQVNYLDETQEKVLQNETKSKEKVSLLKKQLQILQEQVHHSELNDDYSDEMNKLKSEFHQVLVEKQTLEQTVSDLNNELEIVRKQEKKITEDFNKVQEELKNKNLEIKSYADSVEEFKEEICLLKAEIESLKFGQIDPNRRGNSLFVEVDDKRKQIEKEMISLKAKYQASKESLQMIMQQRNKMKHQMATLWNMTSLRADATYIEKLEQTLFQAKRELQELNQQLQKSRELEMNSNDFSNDKLYAPDYLKTMLQQYQKEMNSLNKQVQQLLFLKAAETDKLIECQQNLYQEKKKSAQLRSEVLQLQLKVDELKNIDLNEAIKPKSVKEKLPGYEIRSLSDKENINLEQDMKNAEKQICERVIIKEEKQTFAEQSAEQKAIAPCINMSNESINGCPQQ